MSYTNSGLVQYCRDALKLKTKYMWGGLFREITAAYINQLAGMYPNQYPASRKSTLNSLVGKGYYGCDCVGLIKSYYFGGVGTANNAKGYDGSKDYGVGAMYNAAKTKGKIATMPQTEGILVMTADFGHVGVYIGNNQVIECTLGSCGDGVVQTDFAKGGWAYWCQCPCIEDDTSKKAAAAVPSTVNSNIIYKSLGTAAKRKKADTSGDLAGKCERGGYYPASQLITPATGAQQWFCHAGTDLYSALNDTPAGGNAKLFEQYGTYTMGVTNAIVNVRATAGLTSTKLAQLHKGAVVYLTGKIAQADGLTWAEIVYNGQLTWLDKQWVSA